MKGRMIVAFVAGVLCCALLIGATMGIMGAFTGDAQARSGGTWQVAGGDDGFAIADWGTGGGPKVSLDDFIESLPASCDIQTIARGAMYLSVLYRCD